MPRQSTIQVVKINVVANPHPIGTYESLFRKAHDHLVVELYRASDYICIGSFEPKAELDRFFVGQLFVFTEFDKSGDWLNIQRLGIASEKEKTAITVPDELKANFRFFQFILDAKRHVLYLETRNKQGAKVSPNAAAVTIRRILERVAQPDTVISTTVEPEKDAIDKIFASDHIDTITITLRLPNPDDDSDGEEEIFRLLREQNAKSQTTRLTSFPGEGLKLNEENLALAEAAARNGHVEARIRDSDGKRTRASTRDYPDVVPIQIKQGEDPVSKIARFFSLF